MTRVAVTGSSGRLGRSIVAALAAHGVEVVGIDREPPSESHPDTLAGAVITREVDLRDPLATTRAMADLELDAVVHLAGNAVPFSAPDTEIVVTNVVLAQHVLAASLELGIRRVLVASSPTVIGYGAPGGWTPRSLPLDEDHPLEPWHAYAVSKQMIEALVASTARGFGGAISVAAFRPCYVIAPEEWSGAPTQQGHTVAERLADPSLAAPSLFNYVDARDVGDFVIAWLARATAIPNGTTFFVGADDALATEPLAELMPRMLPELAPWAGGLTGRTPAFSNDRAGKLLGWHPRRTWRSELRARPASADATSADATSADPDRADPGVIP